MIASRFNALVVERLTIGAIDGLRRHGVAEDAIDIVHVPGALEIPIVARRLAASGRYVAVICLGTVVRGDTAHYDVVVSGAAQGIAQASAESGIPVLNAVLTTDTVEQALDRAGAKHGNKGFDTALAALEMVNLLAQLPGPATPTTPSANGATHGSASRSATKQESRP